MKFRDVYPMLQKLRNFLIINRTPHLKHNRFMPFLSPRSIPTPDIPRGPDCGYSKQYYFNRSARNSVLPPVVAPVGIEGGRRTKIAFPTRPTPGCAYWFDAHCYYEWVPDYAPPEQSRPKTSPPDEPPPRPRPEPPSSPKVNPCDPCQPSNKPC